MLPSRLKKQLKSLVTSPECKHRVDLNLYLGKSVKKMIYLKKNLKEKSPCMKAGKSSLNEDLGTSSFCIPGEQ